MAKDSHIQWTDHTWNPWWGCVKVSEGCRECYAEGLMKRFLSKEDDPFGLKRTADKTMNFPLTVVERMWKDEGKDLVFTCSMSDFFIEGADEWRGEAWDVIRRTPHLKYQILTKRPERIEECLPDDWGEGWENVWLGISVENHRRFKERIGWLLDVPAKMRFLSVEPLLGPVNMEAGLAEIGRNIDEEMEKIDWVIIGGESGPKARMMAMGWVKEVMNSCKFWNLPVFVKQMGSVIAVGMKWKDKKGGDWEEWKQLGDGADWLLVRDFPKGYKRRVDFVTIKK